MKLVWQTGFPIERFRKRLEDADLTNEESKTQLIKDLHQQWMEKIELRRAQIEAGTSAPKKKKPASNWIDTSDVDWVPSDEDLSFDPTSWGDGAKENAW